MQITNTGAVLIFQFRRCDFFMNGTNTNSVKIIGDCEWNSSDTESVILLEVIFNRRGLTLLALVHRLDRRVLNKVVLQHQV
jgi:hypothetical protein